MSEQMIKIGDAIFSDIETNPYLNKLYEKILVCYSDKLFNVNNVEHTLTDKELCDALQFADLLSKSTHPSQSDLHKMWAQEIVILSNEIYQKNPLVKTYACSVFSATANYQGLQQINAEYQETNIFEKTFAQFRNDYLTIPADPTKRFFAAQREVYSHLTDSCFSYSGPTSMGKSFIMRMFIKDEVLIQHHKKNYALVVPTKALITEIRNNIINDLGEGLKQYNYRVVTAASDMALEENHNFVFVLTPERLLYLLISKPDVDFDYLFIDEAHKLSGKNSRGPFYYKVVDMLLKREHRPRFIFASPNIPNPQVYLEILGDLSKHNNENKLASTYSPVIQVKYLLDFNSHFARVYNERANHIIDVAELSYSSLYDMLWAYEEQNSALSPENRTQTIIYFNGRDKAISAAKKYAEAGCVKYKNDSLLDALSKDIKQQIHKDYFLSDLITKGIAYHIGYLPASIRARIEDLFKTGHITTMFCTNTLLEGVNLPADNLFITDNRIYRSSMSPVDFRNLIGRVGRISYNLYGNVFFVSDNNKNESEKYIEMLRTPIPAQKLSISTDPKNLRKIDKQRIVETLKSGSSVFIQKQGQSDNEYVMMRKFGLILLRDILQNNKSSLVMREFYDFLTDDIIDEIRCKFNAKTPLPDDDINTSIDQTRRLIIAIKNGLKFPNHNNGFFAHQDVVEFLNKLADIFDWSRYEKSTLGNDDSRRYYAVILCQWMEGLGLNQIMDKALEHHKQYPNNFRLAPYLAAITYNDSSMEHRNVVFAETLDVIENVVLFSISNYFLRFANEYKKIYGVESFDNNWYEYVEFGTTNPLTILLQRNGFSREAALFIKTHKDEYVIEDLATGEFKLKADVLTCNNATVASEAAHIILNAPEIFTHGER